MKTQERPGRSDYSHVERNDTSKMVPLRASVGLSAPPHKKPALALPLAPHWLGSPLQSLQVTLDGWPAGGSRDEGAVFFVIGYFGNSTP
jgi:hypothetical protein